MCIYVILTKEFVSLCCIWFVSTNLHLYDCKCLLNNQVNAGQWFLQATSIEVAELLPNGGRAIFALDLLYWILILGSCHFSSILAVWHTRGGDKSLCSTAFKSLYGNSTQQPNKSQRHPGSIPLWKQVGKAEHFVFPEQQCQNYKWIDCFLFKDSLCYKNSFSNVKLLIYGYVGQRNFNHWPYSFYFT